MENLKKESFFRELNDINYFILCASDLLGNLGNAALESNLSGVFATYRNPGESDDCKAAFRWIREHYNDISSSVRAAECILMSLSDKIDRLDERAHELIPQGDEQNAKKKS